MLCSLLLVGRKAHTRNGIKLFKFGSNSCHLLFESRLLRLLQLDKQRRQPLARSVAGSGE